MNDSIEVEQNSTSTRNLIGRIIIWMGFVLLVSGVILMFSVSLWIYLSNINGAGISTTPFTYQIPSLITIIGIVSILIGVIVRYSTNRFSKDGLWTLQTGPYVK